MKPLPPRHGFTLIELLISMAIGLLLVSLAFAGYRQIRTTITRSEARVDMHQRAAVVYRTLSTDLSSAMPSVGMWVRSVKTDPADLNFKGPYVEMVFMKGKTDPSNWNWTQNEVDIYHANSDLIWCIWRWDQQAKTLSQGSSRWQRLFKNHNTWTFPAGNTGNDWIDRDFRVLPKPVRIFSDPALPWATLEENTIRSGANRDVEDIGDYTDLLQQMRPAVRNVVACTMQLVMSDNAPSSPPLTFDGSANVVRSFDGIPLDSAMTKVPTGDNDVKRFKASEVARRPRMFRMLFTVRDPRLDLQQTFSVSAQFPGLLPDK